MKSWKPYGSPQPPKSAAAPLQRPQHVKQALVATNPGAPAPPARAPCANRGSALPRDTEHSPGPGRSSSPISRAPPPPPGRAPPLPDRPSRPRRAGARGQPPAGRRDPPEAPAAGPARPHLGVHVGQAVAAELVEEPLALEVVDDHGDQLGLGRAAPHGGPGPRQRRRLLRGRWRGRRRWGLRLGVAGHGGGGAARPAQSAAAGSPGRTPGRGWLPSSGRGSADPGSERERREEAPGDGKGSSDAAAESGAIGARRALPEPRAAAAGPLRRRRGRSRWRPAPVGPRSGGRAGERGGRGGPKPPPALPAAPRTARPRLGAAGTAGPPAAPAARRPAPRSCRAPRRCPHSSAPRPAPSCAGRHHGGGSVARFLPQARGGAGGGACRTLRAAGRGSGDGTR